MSRHWAVLFVFSALPACCGDWNPRLAAEYLDGRQKEWFAWPRAMKTGVPCVSCHTGATYLLARPALRKALGEKQPTAYETGLLDGLRGRVAKMTPKEMFGENAKEPSASQAASVEAIFSALFLAMDNAEFNDTTRRAFDRMWSLQLREGSAKGAWAWNTFDLDPWEMPESAFYGAALAALATGSAPAEYRNEPAVRERISELTGYLQREVGRQPLHNRLLLLWASTRLPEALPVSIRRTILEETWRKQQPDGGWAIDSLGQWKKHAQAPASTGTSSYATGFTTLLLEKAGVQSSDPRMVRALDWLRSHQDPSSGYWAAESMNKVYEADYMPVLFMRDAATSYAALALLGAEPSTSTAALDQHREPR